MRDVDHPADLPQQRPALRLWCSEGCGGGRSGQNRQQRQAEIWGKRCAQQAVLRAHLPLRAALTRGAAVGAARQGCNLVPVSLYGLKKHLMSGALIPEKARIVDPLRSTPTFTLGKAEYPAAGCSSLQSAHKVCITVVSSAGKLESV